MASLHSIALGKPLPGLGDDTLGGAESFPLSYNQERLWLAEQLRPGTPTYNLPEAWMLDGKPETDALQQALDEVVQHHETLRTFFRTREGKPQQRIVAASRLKLKQVNLSQYSDPKAELERRLGLEARVPFDLGCAPLARATLFQIAPGRHALFFNVHHLISDAWSQSILIRELVERYTAKLVGQICRIAELPVQFADFCLWQRELVRSDAGQAHLAYWKKKLAGIKRSPGLFGEAAPRSTGSHDGATCFVKLPGELTRRIREIGRGQNATVFMTLLAAFKVLLRRYTLEDQVVVGVPMAGRERSELEQLVGFFVQVCPVCSDLAGDPPFLALVDRIRETVLETVEHQEVPCELALNEETAATGLSRQPLFRYVFGWQGVSVDHWSVPGLSATKAELETGTAKFEWTILVSEIQDGLLLRSEFNKECFEPEVAARLLRQFQALLHDIAAGPARKISELHLESRQERGAVLQSSGAVNSDYGRGLRIHEVFEAQAAATPASVAVEFEGVSLSYGELNRRANQFANLMLQRGVAPGAKVGLCLDRSLELIPAILGILKAGGAYVPLDPDTPRERIRFVLEDCAVRTVVSKQQYAGCFGSPSRLDLLLVDESRDQLESAMQQNPGVTGTSADLAYIMYTSGSTGLPKGALIPHRAVLRLVRNTNYLEFTPDQTFLQYAPISFDASTFEIWGALLNGAKLVVAAPGVFSLEQLGRTIRERRVTTVWLTAGLFNQMVDHRVEDLRGVKYLLAGGEALSPAHVSEALKRLEGVQLINGYGPTENTTFTCCFQLPTTWPASRPVPIGQPILNTNVFVLDQNRVPVPIGVPGELYAGGDGLALGYLNRSDLTAERFVPNPFEPDARLYRTGDLVRRNSDGTLEFLRRLDDQVKIRGHRVEPAEVEHTLAEVSWVESSAVVARADRSGTKQLVAYVIARPATTANLDQLRTFVRSKLPVYAVPSQWVLVSELPLTANGKVDRRALARLPLPETPAEASPLRTASTPTEERLIEIWREVLDRKEIGVDQDFFELGGHSLLATQVISRIGKVFKRELEMRAIFDAPTIAQLAIAVEKAEAVSTVPEFTCSSSISSEEASRLLERLDELSEAELDQLLRDTALQSTL